MDRHAEFTQRWVAERRERAQREVDEWEHRADLAEMKSLNAADRGITHVAEGEAVTARLFRGHAERIRAQWNGSLT